MNHEISSQVSIPLIDKAFRLRRTRLTRKRRLATAAVGVTLAMALSSAGVASATAGEPHPLDAGPPREHVVAVVGGGDVVPQMSPAEIEDLRTYATQNGLSFDNVQKAAVGQVAFDDTVAALEAKYAASIVSEEWIGSGSYRAKVVFHGSVPEGAMNLLERSPVTVQVVTSTAPSAQDRDRATEAAYRAAVAVPGAAESIASSDPATGTITVEVPRGAPVEVVEASAQENVDAMTGDRLSEVQVVRSGRIQLGATEYRGGMIYPSRAGCTGGFTVRSGSTYGVVTARHCGSASTYNGGKFKTHRYLAAATGDMRWERATSGKPSPTFQYKHGSFRTVTSVVNPKVGQPICKYGRTTNNTCSTVYKTGLCASGYCGLYATTAYISDKGDSGGPWYYGNIARGIHHGSADIGGKRRSLFTRIGVLAYLDASVLRG